MIHVDKHLNSALDALISFTCSRPCCKPDTDICSPHAYANLNRFMWDGKKFPYSTEFENDLEHGIFHGVMTYLIATILDKHLIDNIDHCVNYYNEDRLRKKYNGDIPVGFHEERMMVAKEAYGMLSIIPGLLFHDAYKVMFDSKNHDAKLKSYFPSLHPSTYKHTIQKNSRTKMLLVKSDRIELLRYPDYNRWVDQSIIYDCLPLNIIKDIQFFYSTIRPVLSKCYKHRNKRWIRHGIEYDIDGYDFNDLYPSNFHGFWGNKTVLGVDDKSKDYWSVEIGLGPVNNCFDRKSNALYENIQGKIPLEQYDGNLHACILRDHLVAKGRVDIEKWIFNFTDECTTTEVNMLYNANIKICSESLVKKTLKAIDNIMNLFYCLKV